MKRNLFELRNVDCAYKKKGDKERIVLSVKELDIPAGKIIFIIGPSGIGKSTILETLGVMNNTIVSNPLSRFEYFQFDTDQTFDLISMWKRNKDKELSSFRRRNFSFIFQQTNLMRNFSAYQNVMITGMLQGKSDRDCAIKSKEIFEAIGMPDFDMSRKATELSGGQQQRLAFARAIIPDFNVLFGDEPTGNLDNANARNLMAQIQNQIKMRQNCTSIIVSHDLDNSVLFADIIVLIEPKEDMNGEISQGIIDKSSVYTKNNDGKWINEDKSYNQSEILSVFRKSIFRNNSFQEEL